MDIQVGGVFGLLILIGDIWAIINILGSRSETLHKLLWILLVIFLPLVGLVIWFFAGPRSNSG
ncbi:PLDc N-terminal domain-containing protein [Haliea sp. E17]|uniref:PLDc N-terminal domain-containing protein n=1 Tax=Haliea sp. E17 TaxID=3401576 RepID=UPI003AAE12A4